MDFATAVFEQGPAGPLEVYLRKDTYLIEEGFGVRANTYPVTVTMARYGGSYEGGYWLAFPVQPRILAEEAWRSWQDSDIECMEWWDRARRENWPIGRGMTPGQAYLNLIEIAAAKAGVDLGEWSEEPTFDKDELRRRSGQDPAL